MKRMTFLMITVLVAGLAGACAPVDVPPPPEPMDIEQVKKDMSWTPPADEPPVTHSEQGMR